ncbi:MAG: CMD domain protein [Alphaproteobacteria bacterium]|nr:CMD domain protein [Alphaproteobacteria bacterium]
MQVPADVVDALVGVTPGSPLDAVRARRSEARKQAQTSWRALFEPADASHMSVLERCAVARFVALLHGRSETAAFYAARLVEAGATTALAAAIEAEAAAAPRQGPYGAYPPGPLSCEDAPGAVWQATSAGRTALGARLAAALEHVHMLVFHPRDAAAPALQALYDAGWSTTGIVTLSQLVAFLSFQIRLVAGLRALAGRS